MGQVQPGESNIQLAWLGLTSPVGGGIIHAILSPSD